MVGSPALGEELDDHRFPHRVVLEGRPGLALDAEIAGHVNDRAQCAGRNGRPADAGQETIAQVLLVVLEFENGVEVDVGQGFVRRVLDPEGNGRDEDELLRPGAVFLEHFPLLYFPKSC